jgi:hypothetical protein
MARQVLWKLRTGGGWRFHGEKTFFVTMEAGADGRIMGVFHVCFNVEN